MSAKLLPGDERDIHLAKTAIAAAIPHSQVAFAELARVEDDHEAGERALVELDAALAQLGAARTAVRDLCGL
jgi:hypothetical protein